jgi:hypothetical protein
MKAVLLQAVLALCFFGLAASSCAGQPKKNGSKWQTWKYNTPLVETKLIPEDLAYPPEPLVIQRNNETNQGGGSWADSAFGAKFSCHSKLICIISGPLTFAVPKQFPDVPDFWDAGQFRFHLFSKKPIPLELLGQKVDVWLIKARDPSDPRFEFEYFYSPRRGLVAYGRIRRGIGVEGWMQWLVGRCGFAAMHCNAEPAQK